MELKLSLSNPGMSDLHKVGLGGLYMTLQSLDLNTNRHKKEKMKESGLEKFLLSKTSVILNFDDKKLGKALEELIKYSFQIDKTGFFYFPALELSGTQPIENKLINQRSLLNTFFQPTLKSCSVEKMIQKNFASEDNRPLILNFQEVLEYASQKATPLLYDSKKNKFEEKILIKNWLYLGGAEKHFGLSGTTLSEKIETFFPLLYATIGCIYVYIKTFDSHLKSKIRACIVIPQIDNLEIFSQIRSKVALSSELRLTMAGLSESALYVLNEYSYLLKTNLKKFPLITVIGVGDTKWNPNQRSKNFVHKIKISNMKVLNQYEEISTFLKSSIKEIKEEKNAKGVITNSKRSYISIPISKELFCTNILNSKEFYKDFYRLVTSMKDKSGKTKRDNNGNFIYAIKFESKELNTMVEKITYDHEGEKIFIKACHIAWKRRLGQLGQRSEKEKIPFENLYYREFERYRSSFSKSKKAETFREVIMDFWSRGGANSELKESWDKILFMLEPENWKKGRDLALLAIVSYKAEDDKINKAIEKTITNIEITEGDEDE